MKKILFFLPLILLCFYASAKDYYISADGNDANNGTSQSTAWKSLNKLNAYFSNLRPGDRVLLRRGDTFYGSINVTRSGTAGAPITIGAYGSGEKPVITGFTTVNSWKNVGGNIWESTEAVSTLPYTNMVVVNGVNTAMGRYPNEGYLHFQSHRGSSSITSNELGGSPNWTGADVVIKKERWTLHRSKITNQSGNTINYKSVDNREPYDGWGFFIQNDPKTLDSPGEWYYDSNSKKLKIFSYGNPSNVKIATVENLVTVRRNSYIILSDLTFNGANSDGFILITTKAVSVKNCDINFIGIKAFTGDMAGNTSIENCTIKDVNSAAVFLMSYGSSGAVIKSNEIQNIGVLPGMRENTTFHAIETNGANSLIQYNNLTNTGYGGISFRGNDVSVKNNFIQKFCMVVDDAGGIYTGHAKEYNKVIDGNVILNGVGNGQGTRNPKSLQVHGIMIDDNGESITITNNTLAHGPNSGLKVHNAHDLKILNNTIYNHGDGINSSKGAIEFMNNSKSLSLIRNISVKNNIFFAKMEYQLSVSFATIFDLNDIKSFGIADNNYFLRPIKNDASLINLLTGDNRWPGYNYGLSGWRDFIGQDKSSKSTPKEISDLSELRFEYNASSQAKTIALDAKYIDAKNNSYNGSITLAPYSSAVLIRAGAIEAGSVNAKAGANQAITLPTSEVTLKGSGEGQVNSNLSYSWSKISGPSTYLISSPDEATTSVKDLVEGVYVFQLKVTDNLGRTNSDEVQIDVNPPESLLEAVNPGAIINGLDYNYYEESNFTVLPDFSNLTKAKSGTVDNFDLSIANRLNGFAVEFTGYIDVPVDGQYTFYITSDDGSKVYIGDKLVVDNDGLHGATEKSGSIGLKAGKHAISIGFFQQDGNKTLNVSYSGPNMSKRQIPNSVLYRSLETSLLTAVNPLNIINGLDYNYYEESNLTAVPDFTKLKPVKSGTVDNVDLSIANRSERFAVQFAGYIEVPVDGQYTFYTTSDDGSLVYIGNKLVVNNDGLHGSTEKSGSIGLRAGKHAISVEFFQQYGGQVLNLSYEGPGISKQSVPGSSLFRSFDLLPAVSPANTVNGLNYNYYEGSSFDFVPDFSKLTPAKTGTAEQFDLSVAKRVERFAIQFTGYIEVPTDGQYTFYTTSDDGSVLFIDDRLVVDNDGLHGSLTRSGSIGLKAGKHVISVGFFQQDWDKVLNVRYEGPGISNQVIPASALYRNADVSGLNYRYYEGGNYLKMPDFSKITPVKTGKVSNFDLSVANRNDVYAIEFSGYINIAEEGRYTFYTTSDDGSLLYINNDLIVNNDGLHSATERAGSVYLQAGQYPIVVSFFQQNWHKILEVKYEGPGISKQSIPSSVLVSESPAFFGRGTNGFGAQAFASTHPVKNPDFYKVDEAGVQVYPNPFVNSFRVSLNGAAGEYNLQLIDAVGRTLWRRTGKKNAGLYQQTIDASKLQKGVYFLKIMQNDETSTIKLLK